MSIDFKAFDRMNDKIAEDKKYFSPYRPIDGTDLNSFCVGNEYEIVKKHLGKLEQNSLVNFWTYGRYTMHDILKWVLLHTGPADVTACTWAICNEAVKLLVRLKDMGYLRSFRLWIDPRVKVRSPEPLSMLQQHFPVTIAPVHAKVTCVSNDDWKVSISGSLNFTTSPQPERGMLCTLPQVWQADYEILERQFNSENG